MRETNNYIASIGTGKEILIGHTSGKGKLGSLHSYSLKDTSHGIKRERAGGSAGVNPTAWHSGEAQGGLLLP